MPRSKTPESRAARKHLRSLVAIGVLTADEAKAIRKDVLASLQPAKPVKATKAVKVAKAA